MLTVALVALILAAVSADPGEKLFTCCKKVSTAEITEPIIKFEIQRPNPPCVRAVIFTTQSGHFCSHLLAPWVFAKIQELRRAKAQSTTPQVVTTTPPSSSSSSSSSSVLSIIATTAPPSSSSPGPSSSSSSSVLSIIATTAPPSSSSPGPSSSSFSSSSSTIAESETFPASRDQ